MAAIEFDRPVPSPPDMRTEYLQFLEDSKPYLNAGGRWTPVVPNRFAALSPNDLTDEEKSSLRRLAAML